jgi:DNA-binding NtrC family response regulator
MSSVLIIDDEPGMRRTLEMVLQKAGFRVTSSADGNAVEELLARLRPDVLITDLKMEPVSGLEVLRRARTCAPATSVMVITAFGTVDSAVEAMKLGAYDYITKPFNNNEFVFKVRKAVESRSGAASARPQRVLIQKSPALPVLGTSTAMRAVQARIEQIAPTSLTVLLTGETGTGKTLVARALHAASRNIEAPFIALNATAVPEPLLESELFGHEKGAFTGAAQSRRGLFEEAHRGTLFLDEIGSLPANVQSKLLGVLQDHELRRIGSNQVIAVDVRVIAATNSPIEQAVARGEFRSDLFYRLNVARIHLPPLRERREDIPELVAAYLARHSRQRAARHTLSTEGLGLLMKHDFPGNVRELENALEWASTIARGEVIGVEHLPESIRAAAESRAGQAPPVGTLDAQEKELILRSIERFGGNLTEAAKALGIGRTTLWRKMRDYGIRK